MTEFYAKRRRIIMRDFKIEDIESFYMHFIYWTHEQKKEESRRLQKKIKEIAKRHLENEKVIIVTDSSEHKMVGKIEAKEIDINTINIDIQVPETSSCYGDEILDQFIKVCREKRLYKNIVVDIESPIVTKYFQNRKIDISNCINVF